LTFIAPGDFGTAEDEPDDVPTAWHHGMTQQMKQEIKNV